jgi:acetyl esterase/lipase
LRRHAADGLKEEDNGHYLQALCHWRRRPTGRARALLETVPASAIVAGMRDPARDEEAANALRQKGVEVRTADYSRPEALATAFAGVDRLLLISSE